MVFNFLLFHFIFLTHVQCPFICIHFEGHVGIVLLVWRGLEGDLFGTIFQIRPIKPSSLVTWHSKCSHNKDPSLRKAKSRAKPFNDMQCWDLPVERWAMIDWLLDWLTDLSIDCLTDWLIDLLIEFGFTPYRQYFSHITAVKQCIKIIIKTNNVFTKTVQKPLLKCIIACLANLC